MLEQGSLGDYLRMYHLSICLRAQRVIFVVTQGGLLSVFSHVFPCVSILRVPVTGPQSSASAWKSGSELKGKLPCWKAWTFKVFFFFHLLCIINHSPANLGVSLSDDRWQESWKGFKSSKVAQWCQPNYPRQLICTATALGCQYLCGLGWNSLLGHLADSKSAHPCLFLSSPHPYPQLQRKAAPAPLHSPETLPEFWR